MASLRLKKDLFWLIVGYLCLSTSAVLYVYDIYHSDEGLIRKIESHIQGQLNECIQYYSSEDSSLTPPESCLSCKLTYNFYGDLTSWTNNEYLPAQRYIRTAGILPMSNVVEFDGDIYYQLKRRVRGNTIVHLIPLYINYDLVNDFLSPYVFLGKYSDRLTSGQIRDLEIINTDARNLSSIDETVITLNDPAGNPIYAILNFNPGILRKNIRIGVFCFLLMGIISLLLSSRQFFMDVLKRDFGSNLIFAGIVLMMRFILWQVNIPGNYLEIELFSPKVVAFHTLAPSLGELTLNIFTLVLVVIMVYRSFHRLLNKYYRKLQNQQVISWIFAFTTIFVSTYLLRLYYSIFKTIIINSQIELEFSNIFTTDFYSYLILLDVGILLFTFLLVFILLFKFNILLGIKQQFSPLFWLAHIAMISASTAYHFYPNLSQDYLFIYHFAIINLSLTLLLIILYRIPFKHVFDYDLTNYVFTVSIVAMIVTSNLTNGVELYKQLDVERVGKQVLQEKLDLTIKFNRVLLYLNTNQESLLDEARRLPDNNAFNQWLQETYIDPNFKGFDSDLQIYPKGTRPKDVEINGTVKPLIVREILDEQIETGARLYLSETDQNTNENLFIGEFSIELDTAHQYDLLLKIIPSEIKVEGLYPSLSMDRELYDKIKQVQGFDFAVYRSGMLYDQNGNSSFPISLEGYLPDYESLSNSYSRIKEKFMEHIMPGDNTQLAIVRYQRQSFLEILTRFSIIFYFYILGSFLFILLPIFFIRWQRGEQTISQLPLRAKIRLMVLIIILVPLVFVVGNFSGFVQNRYIFQTESTLNRTTTRITNLIEQECSEFLEFYPESRTELIKTFQEIANYVEDDVTLYDGRGKYIASTQPQIFETGISSDLMNSQAYTVLRKDKAARLLHKENIGNLSFFAAYQPILNEHNEPIGYVNVPYLGRQDQLNQQVQDFLSYFVNTYLLIFLVVNIIAVLVSNTITQPLQLLQARLSATRLGDYNRRIDYKSNDEVGDIIKAYNIMLDKLSESEEKLKQSQREKAWRQMARQVAHEIKNPLTPMKLSIQHINRAWGEQSVHLNKMFPRFVKTLLSQIDTLARIANSFSEFAKMPEPHKERISVNEILLEVVDLYAQSEDTEWNIDVSSEEFWVFSDRDQLSRCFQNVIKNGLQAIESRGVMDIRLYENGHDTCVVEIKDNGDGMSEEVQEMIFEPNFSTKTSGMGLGLAMVRRIIEISGGRIYFKSELKKGTTFYIELPLNKDN